MPLLSGSFPTRAQQPRPTKVLHQARLPPSQQTAKSATLAEQTGEPGLLPRPASSAAGAGLARGPSGILAQDRREASPAVTRFRPQSSLCRGGGCGRRSAGALYPYVTRYRSGANASAGGDCLPVHRFTVTRGPRGIRAAHGSQRPRSAGDALRWIGQLNPMQNP